MKQNITWRLACLIQKVTWRLKYPEKCRLVCYVRLTNYVNWGVTDLKHNIISIVRNV